jgi:hypothetical protein
MWEVELDLPDVQQPTLIPLSYEGMLLSRPSFAIGTNIFGNI